MERAQRDPPTEEEKKAFGLEEAQVKRCEAMLEKIDAAFEQCDAPAKAGSDYCWECQQLGNTKAIVRKATVLQTNPRSIAPHASNCVNLQNPHVDGAGESGKISRSKSMSRR